jgi:N-acetylglucosaminyl-diphospho-decaprenol L-rhamnosyltransferase
MEMATTGDEAIALSIIIVSYNSRDITLACLESVYAYPPSVPFEIILIDNASPDGSAAAIAAAWPKVRLIASPENHGFALGNNIAAKQARGSRILLLNPDTVVFPGSLSALWDFAQASPARRIWGGRTLFADGTLNPTSCWAAMTVWSLFCATFGLTWLFPRSELFAPEWMGDWQRDSEREVDIVTGCFLMIDRELWESLGGFDRTFFMYAEEADLCIRASKLGARPAITPQAEIIHLGGASEASATDKTIKTLRGRATLIRKHWSPPRRFAGLALYWLWALGRLIGSRLFVGPRDVPGESRSKWQMVWKRRREWLAGYPIIKATDGS